jgi:hypothetical protein
VIFFKANIRFPDDLLSIEMFDDEKVFMHKTKEFMTPIGHLPTTPTTTSVNNNGHWRDTNWMVEHGCWVQAKQSSTDIIDSWMHTPHQFQCTIIDDLFPNIISYTSWLPVIGHLHEKCSLLGLSSSQVPTTRFLIKKMLSI